MLSGQNIVPTHTCFDDALDFLDLLDTSTQARIDDAMESLRVVHGVCVSSTGTRYAHAWVEEYVREDPDRADWPDYAVWQGMLHNGQRGWYAVERDWFLAAFKVEDCSRYTLTEAAWLNVSSGHYGPWLSRYRKLCGGGHIVGVVQGAAPLGMVLL